MSSTNSILSTKEQDAGSNVKQDEQKKNLTPSEGYILTKQKKQL